MKKLFLFSVGIFISIGALYAQGGISQPIVTKAVYFDISPPLRDMVQDTNATADMSWKVNIVKGPMNTFSNDSYNPDPYFEDPIRQYAFGQIQTDTTLQNFQGVGTSGYYPPDANGDVGPNHYFQVVNIRYAIYDKDGVMLVGPLNNSSIFAGLPNNSNDGDAIVLYDENADRWLFSQFSLPNYPYGPFYENVAISQTSDPTGTWYRYQFQFADMPDYPKLSVWGDGYYMTIRKFASGSGNWLGPAVVAMDRTEMLTGNPAAAMVMFSLPTSSEGPLAADCDSEFPPDSTPCPVCYLNSNGTTSNIKLYEFHPDWVTPANSTFGLAYTIPITPFSFWSYQNVITQKGTSKTLDAFSRKVIMHRMPLRKFSDHLSMLLNTTVQITGSLAGIRWMELRHDGSDWSLYQEGTYSPDNNHRWMGSIALDSLGNIALGYSISSTSMYPSIRYTGRLNGDSLGVMTIAEKGIINGGGSQTINDGRWGDYSAMVADPVDIGKFWYTQEYYTSTSQASWKTRIASFSFADIYSVNVTATPESVCFGDSTLLTAAAVGGSGSYTYSWASIPPGITSTSPNLTVSPVEDTKYYCIVDDGSQLKTDTVFVEVNENPEAFAGNDTIMLTSTAIVNLFGEASNYLTLLWTTNGDGNFWKDTILTTFYYPGPIDLTMGVGLTLTATPRPTCTEIAANEMIIHFVPAVGVPEAGAEAFSLFLMPNPTKGLVTMNLNGLNGFETALSITSMQGKYVHREVIEAGQSSVTNQVDLSGFPGGIYFVQVRSQMGTIVQKLVIE